MEIKSPVLAEGAVSRSVGWTVNHWSAHDFYTVGAYVFFPGLEGLFSYTLVGDVVESDTGLS